MDEIDPESPDSIKDRYMSSSVSDVSDPDYWLQTCYEYEGDETEP